MALAANQEVRTDERRVAILIGINEYRQGVPPLRNAVRDVQAVANVLRDEHGYEVRLLTDELATRAGLRVLFGTLRAELTASTRLLVYFAGHGIADDTGEDASTPQGFLLPQDARRDDVTSFLPMAEVQAFLSQLPCRHLLLVLDCCFAGAFRWSQTRSIGVRAATLYRERYERYLRDAAWQVIASAASDERALDMVAGGKLGQRGGVEDNSPFAAALCRGLQGAADLRIDGQPGDGVIIANELHLYLESALGQLEQQLGRSVQKPLLWSLDGRDKGQFVFFTPGRTPALPSALQLIEKNNPYRGLQAYEEANASLFFGRGEVVAQLEQQVLSQPLTVVSGNSGSGKSSVVRAGLIPRLRSRRDWHVLPVTRPGSRPDTTLRSICAELGSAGASELALAVAEWQANHPGQRLLLVIDQLEELTTLGAEQGEQQQFLASVGRALAENPGHFAVVMTLRADFEPHFAELLQRKSGGSVRFLIRPPSRQELRQIIEGPASERVLYFDPVDLVDQLIDEVADTPGALPLLSFALSELYRAYVRSGRSDRCLSAADFRSLNGVAGALSQRADELFQSLPPESQSALGRTMLRMVSGVGNELTRRRLPLSELQFADPAEDAQVREVLQRLVEARLVVIGQAEGAEAYAEPAHDTLLLGWRRFWQWIHRERETLPLLRRLGDAATEWHREGRPAWRLWHDDPRLSQIQALAESDSARFNAVELAFLAATELRRQELERQLKEAKLRLAQIYEDQGRQLLLQGRPFRAVVYLVAALKEGGQTSSLRSLLRRACRWLAGHRVVTGHTAPVLSATFSPDGSRLLTASRDGTARIWDSETAANQLVLPEHQGAVSFAAFSPDGRQVVTADEKGTCRLWDALTGELLSSTEHAARARPLASEHGIWIVSHKNRCTEVWDALRPQAPKVAVEEARIVVAMALSADGRCLATAGADGLVSFWDTASGTQLATLKLPARSTDVLSLSPRGTHAAIINSALATYLCDVQSGALLHTLPGYYPYPKPGRESLLVFSPNRGRLVTMTNSDQAARIWEVHSGKLLSTLAAHSNSINSVAFSQNGQRLATASEDQTACVWDAQDGRLVGVLEGHRAAVLSARFSADGRRLVTASSDGTAQLWDVTPDAAIQTLTGASAGARFSPDGKSLATVDQTGTAWVWDRGASVPRLVLTLPGVRFCAASFSPDGQRLLTASEQGLLHVWDATSGVQLLLLSDPALGPTLAEFSPDGAHILSAARDGGAHLWDSATGELRLTLATGGGGVLSASFCADGTRVVIVERNHTLRILRVKDNQLLLCLEGQHGEIRRAALSQSGSRVATVGQDRNIKIWDTANGQLLSILEGHGRTTTAVAFDSQDARIVSASRDETARLWNAQNGQLLAVFAEHTDQVLDASFSHDGSWVLTSSLDGTAKIWDAQLETRTFDELAALLQRATPFQLDQGRLLPKGS